MFCLVFARRLPALAPKAAPQRPRRYHARLSPYRPREGRSQKSEFETFWPQILASLEPGKGKSKRKHAPPVPARGEETVQQRLRHGVLMLFRAFRHSRRGCYKPVQQLPVINIFSFFFFPTLLFVAGGLGTVHTERASPEKKRNYVQRHGLRQGTPCWRCRCRCRPRFPIARWSTAFGNPRQEELSRLYPARQQAQQL